MLRDAALVAIAGIGMVMVILLGEIDLSVGSVQAVAGIVAVAVLNSFSARICSAWSGPLRRRLYWLN